MRPVVNDPQNARLKKARSIIRGVFLTRYSESGIDGNDMRAINSWKRDLLWTQAGYGFLHQILWEALSRQEEPSTLVNGDKAGLFNGVYAKLTENGFTIKEIEPLYDELSIATPSNTA
jgi:hypothetical protein